MSSSKAAPPNWFQADDDTFWRKYLVARPTYSPEFYTSFIFPHHTHQGSNNWTLAHDLACGPGNVSTELAPKFDKVIASDISPDHTTAASERAKQVLNADDAKKLGYLTCPAQDVWKTSEAASQWNGKTDLLTFAECGFINNNVAIECFENLLAPGGTLAMWFYGRPIFIDAAGEVNHPVQLAYDKFVTTLFERVGNLHDPMVQKGNVSMSNFFDDFRFDQGERRGKWKNVHRVKWNSDRPMCFFREDIIFGRDPDKVPPLPSDDKVDEINDRDFWAIDWDASQASSFTLSLTPSFEASLAEQPTVKKEIDDLYEKLVEVMGGADKKHKVTWPVVLVLAVRA